MSFPRDSRQILFALLAGLVLVVSGLFPGIASASAVAAGDAYAHPGTGVGSSVVGVAPTGLAEVASTQNTVATSTQKTVATSSQKTVATSSQNGVALAAAVLLTLAATANVAFLRRQTDEQ